MLIQGILQLGQRLGRHARELGDPALAKAGELLKCLHPGVRQDSAGRRGKAPRKRCSAWLD